MITLWRTFSCDQICSYPVSLQEGCPYIYSPDFLVTHFFPIVSDQLASPLTNCQYVCVGLELRPSFLPETGTTGTAPSSFSTVRQSHPDWDSLVQRCQCIGQVHLQTLGRQQTQSAQAAGVSVNAANALLPFYLLRSRVRAPRGLIAGRSLTARPASRATGPVEEETGWGITVSASAEGRRHTDNESLSGVTRESIGGRCHLNRCLKEVMRLYGGQTS